jgi:hypothetical protein
MTIERQALLWNGFLAAMMAIGTVVSCDRPATQAAPPAGAGQRTGVPDLPLEPVDGGGQDWQGETMAPASDGVE